MTNLSSLLGAGLSATGGKITAGRPQVTNAAATGTINLSADTDYFLTLTGATTLALPSGLSTGQEHIITTIVGQSGSSGFALTLPTGVKWSGGTAPTTNTTAGQFDYFTFVSPDGGNTWFGRY